MDSRIGEVINAKYKLIRLLGDGGMGSVYEAQHEVLGTRVAIKVLHTELARRTGLVERFLQEARVAAQIKSAHVVQVVDVDRTANGQAFIVMELLDGEPLSTILDRQGRLSVSMATEYIVQILEALEAAHALGVVHRDLKPENVFVTFLGGKPVLKLIDFGIAKIRRDDPAHKNLTIAGVVMGTAEYMAPEQARSAAEADARSDIYAVGVMLYEMLAGTRPVPGDDARIIALKVERGEVIPLVQAMPEVPREIAGLVHRAMAARPELRFASATEMRLALASAMSGKRAAAGGQTGQMPQVAVPAGVAAAAKELDQTGATGTLKGAPADAVIAAAATRQQAAVAAMTPPQPEEHAPRTQRAPPPVHVVLPPAPAYDNAPRRASSGGMGGKLLILAIPVVIGAGILIAVAASGGSRGKPQGLDIGGGNGASTGATTTTATTATRPAAPTDTTLRPLDNGGSHPTPPRPTGGPGVPSTAPSGVPTTPPSSSGAVDAGAAPPSTAPTGLPGFFDGGAFTIPTTLPSVLPPVTIPSTLPFPFPGAPQPQPEPTPPPAPPHHGRRNPDPNAPPGNNDHPGF